MRKIHVLSLASAMLTLSAQAVPLTHFLPNATGGFDAFIYPELTNGTPSLQGGVFTLPQTVNPGFVVILNSASAKPKDTRNWLDVIRFFDSGSGVVNSIEMFRSGPNQTSYFPALSVVLSSSHTFLIAGQGATAGAPMFTNFTDYSVVAQQTRNYHFYTGPFPIPDEGSTLILLSFATAAILLFHRKLRRA